MNIDIHSVCDVAIEAGFEIMRVYESGDYRTSSKQDNSPLTIADRNSHSIIKNSLNKMYPEIPVISEEGIIVDYELRKNLDYFWLVDPLDGTKEFLKRNGEFTVNIALVKKNTPVAGVVYIPEKEILYYADHSGAFRSSDYTTYQITVNKNYDIITAVKSRSHSTEEEELFYSQFNIDNVITAGSSLKFCLIAEGRASLYFRGGPTWEWDTAAGHALVKYAGGFMTDVKEGEFLYNKPSLLNNGFCASAFKIGKKIALHADK